MKSLFLTLVLASAVSLLAFGETAARADDLAQAAADIPEFHQVSDGIYRGGHPEQNGLADLAQLGVKTVIDLENDESVNPEVSAGSRLGLNVIPKPMSMFWAPSDADADAILALLADPANRPVFIHCTLGQDRTGLMIGLYRVLNEKMPAAQAYSEMLGYGFKSNLLFPLDGYFRRRTGFTGGGF